MQIIISSETNPYFNLALEEILFKKFNKEYFLLYINTPSVICGKHQIPFKEVRADIAYQQNIQICRRFSGGGTVYHDNGNLNFSYITNNQSSNEINIDFRKFTEPVFNFLLQKKLPASINERNNILLDGKKISGNAQHVAKKRTLHHGTLLFNTDLDMMNLILTPQNNHYNDKSVRSAQAEATNIYNYLQKKMNLQEFTNDLSEFMKDIYRGQTSEVSEEIQQATIELSENKYKTDKWVFGYSPAYEISGKIETESPDIDFFISVKEGHVNQVDSNSVQIKKFLELTLGKPHNPIEFSMIYCSFYNNTNAKTQKINPFIFNFF